MPRRRAIARSPRFRVEIRQRQRDGRTEFYCYVGRTYVSLGTRLVDAQLAADRAAESKHQQVLLELIPSLCDARTSGILCRAIRLAAIGDAGPNALSRAVAVAELEVLDMMSPRQPEAYTRRLAPQAAIPEHFQLSRLPLPRRELATHVEATIVRADGTKAEPAPVQRPAVTAVDLPGEEAAIYYDVQRLDAILSGGTTEQVGLLQPLVESVGLALHRLGAAVGHDAVAKRRAIAYRLYLVNALAVLTYEQPAFAALYQEALQAIEVDEHLQSFVTQHESWLAQAPRFATVDQTSANQPKQVEAPLHEANVEAGHANRLTDHQASAGPDDPHLLEDVWPAVLKYRTRWQKRTRENYHRVLADFAAFCTANDLSVRWSTITQRSIRAYTDHMRKPRPRATKGLQDDQIGRRLRDLRFILISYLEVTGKAELLADPELAFKHHNTDNRRNRKSQEQPNALRAEHIRRVYDIAQGEGLPAYASVLVAVALYSGLRKEGLSQLSWRQGKPDEPGTLDRQGETTWVFFVQEKGKFGARWTRGVPVPQALRPLLEAWHETLGQPKGGSLWGIGSAGHTTPGSTLQALVYREIGELMKKLTPRFRKELGIGYVLHDFRRTTISRMHAQGFPPTAISAWVGHKRPTTGAEQAYLRLDHPDFARIVELFDPLNLGDGLV